MPEKRAVMTIVAVLFSGLYGGPHNIVAQWARFLTPHNIRVVAILAEEGGGAALLLRQAGVEVRTVPVTRIRRNLWLTLWWLWRLIPDILRLRRAIADEGADVVAVMRSIDFTAGVAGRLAKRRVVWHVLDSAPPRWLRLAAGRVVVWLAHAIPVMTPTIARMHGIADHPKVTYIGPPSDEAVFRPGLPAGQAFGPRHGPRVGVIANLTWMKGVEYFIRAAAIVARRVPDAEFVIVGGEHPGHEAYAASLRTEVDLLGLSSRLRFVGPRHDLPQIFADLDVFVVASLARSEGLPTVLLNAVMAGVPAVTTAVGGIPDVIEHGKTGLLVPPGNESAMAEAIIALLLDGDLRQRIAATAMKEVAPRYSLRAWQTAYLGVFTPAG